MSVIVDQSQAVVDIDSGEEPVVRIERSKVWKTRSLGRCLTLVNGWSMLCLYVVILSLISFSLVLYLKLSGEVMPFCLYDNSFYMVYYVFLSLGVVSLIPLTDLDLFAADHSFWRWTRRVGAYICVIECEALIYFMIFFKDIAYEVEFDDEAQALVWSLASVGVMRFMTILCGFWLANNWLKCVQQKYKISAKHFGSNFTDIMDLMIAQMLLMSLMYYKLKLYNFGFCLTISYIYFCFARN